MPKKYVAVRMPIGAYNNFVKRKIKLENVASKITRRIIRIPLTRVLRISSETPITLPDKDVFNLITEGKNGIKKNRSK